MAIAFRAGSARTDNFASASPVVTKGANIVDGDLIVLGFVSDTTHTRGSATLNGFTDLGVQADAAADGSLSVLIKIASGEGSSWTFTNLFAASEGGICGQAAYSGVDATTPMDVADTQGTGTGAGEQLAPSITPVTAGAWVVTLFGSDPAANPRTWTPDASPAATERLDAQNALLGYIFIQDWDGWTSGAVQLGATPNASEGSAIFSLALRPAAAAGASLVWQPAPSSLYLR